MSDIPEWDGINDAGVVQVGLDATRIGRVMLQVRAHLNQFALPTVSERVRELDAIQVARYQAQLQALNEAAEELKTAVGKAYDHIRVMVLPGKMDDQGLGTFKIDGVGRVSVTADIHAGILEGKKDEAYKWLEEIGSGDLIVETVNASSLKAVLRKRIKAGEDVPGDIFRISPFDRASITKA